ncbi:Transcription initiation factor TFIID subunit [Zostera marina]|uniref:Transcription initiation factor TFIID subunit n=1 Tax=Zostera marina TaxID=29655 RepID=A0A0K9P232_ZOSMR|nr:Transcription initiation factor TFIID subunit [Zostera marina]
MDHGVVSLANSKILAVIGPKSDSSTPHSFHKQNTDAVIRENNGVWENETLPKDARIIKFILKSMGVEKYEPRVIWQFLELSYRYVKEVLSDAQIYSNHASKSSIDVDDVKLAIQNSTNSIVSPQLPSHDILIELAKSKNKLPLPKLIGNGGMRILPEQDTLINPNYQLFIPEQHCTGSDVDVEIEEEDEHADTSGNPNPNQIPVTNVTSPVSQYHVKEEQQQQVKQQRVSFFITAAKRSKNSSDLTMFRND